MNAFCKAGEWLKMCSDVDSIALYGPWLKKLMAEIFLSVFLIPYLCFHVSCAQQEVFLAELLHSCSRQILELSRFKLRRSVNCQKNLVAARAQCTRPRRRQNQVAHTWKSHTAQGPWTQEIRKGNYREKRARTAGHSVFKSIQWIINPIKSLSPSKANIFRSITVFYQYPATCLMQRSSPEGSLVRASDVPLITASYTWEK